MVGQYLRLPHEFSTRTIDPSGEIMPRRIGFILAAFLVLFPTIQLSAQTAYNFKKLVSTGNLAPVPPRLSDILEFSFNDKSQIAYVGDGGLLFRSGQTVSIIAGYGHVAPGGGKFIYADTVGLNSLGQIVFRGEVTSPSTSGLFLYFKGKLTELITDGTGASNGVFITPTSPVINSAGDVAFIDGPTSGLYLFSKGVISSLAVAGDPAPGGGTFTVVSQQAINQSDQVVFTAYLSTGGSGVYLASGGTITKIIATGDTFPDGGVFSFPVGPSINDAGQIAFGGVSNGSSNDDGLFLFSGGQLKVVVPISAVLPNGSNLSFATGASLNNAGQIAFTAFTDSPNGTGVFLLSGGKVTQAALTGETSPDGDIFGLGGELGAQINSSGQVLLLSSMTYHNDTLYLFSSGQLTRVAGQGDTVNHKPQFEFPTALGIGTGDAVLFSDSTFPGGVGSYVVSAGPTGVTASLVANVGASLGSGVIDYAPLSYMNRGGQVAMAVDTLDEYAEVLLKSGNSITVIGGGPGSQVSPSLNPGQLAINNLGQVAFFAYGGQSGLFLNANGQTSLLLSSSTVAPGGGTLGDMWNISLNSQGQVAFFAAPSAPSQIGVFSYSNGTLTPLALNGSAAPGGGNFSLAFLNLRFGPVTNDNGTVAFGSYIDSSSGSAVFLYSNSALTRIVGPGDPAPGGGTFVSADSPSINAAGQVAFYGETTVDVGIFLYSNGQITRVGGSGDVIGKLTLGYVDEPRLNDNGDVAFMSNLTNGTTAIFVAAHKSASSQDQATPLTSRPIAPTSSTVRELKARLKRVADQRRKGAPVGVSNQRSGQPDQPPPLR
jgi:hypothetical protein